jgi:hypothetical protein
MRLVFTIRRERSPFGVYAKRPALHSGSGFHVPRMAFAVPTWPTRGMLLTSSFRLRRTRDAWMHRNELKKQISTEVSHA